MIIKIEIPAEQEQEFIGDFLLARPIPVDEDGQPTVELNQWVIECASQMINAVRRRGAEIRYKQEQPPFVPPVNVVEVGIIS